MRFLIIRNGALTAEAKGLSPQMASVSPLHTVWDGMLRECWTNLYPWGSEPGKRESGKAWSSARKQKLLGLFAVKSAGSAMPV